MEMVKVERGNFVRSYTDMRDLFEDHDPDFLDSLTEEQRITLNHVLDFEDYCFLVVNYETVVVVADGVVASFETMDQFKEETRQFIVENT